MGIRGNVSRNTLANANARRDWRIYRDLAMKLIGEARSLYADEELGTDLSRTVYVLDSTTINLCLSLFPWARFRRRKGAVKLHTLLDLRGNIPSFVVITPGDVHDVRILDNILIEAGSIYVMDRGYIDFARFHRITRSMAWFVTRAKSNLDFRRLYSLPADKSLGVLSDQVVALRGFYTRSDYPDKLRRVRYLDAKRNKRLVFLTNNFILPASTIADLYRCRWQAQQSPVSKLNRGTLKLRTSFRSDSLNLPKV